MKNPFDAFGRCHNGSAIGNIALYDIQATILAVLPQVGALPDSEVVERANLSALRK